MSKKNDGPDSMITEFKYDSKTYRAVSPDPEIFVENLSCNKDKSWTLCLNLHKRKIVFGAYLEVHGKPPGPVEYHWTIEMLPTIDRKIPTYRFVDVQERREAADIALRAMKVMLSPGGPGSGETPIVTAEFSPLLKKVLAVGHI